MGTGFSSSLLVLNYHEIMIIFNKSFFKIENFERKKTYWYNSFPDFLKSIYRLVHFGETILDILIDLNSRYLLFSIIIIYFVTEFDISFCVLKTTVFYFNILHFRNISKIIMTHNSTVHKLTILYLYHCRIIYLCYFSLEH